MRLLVLSLCACASIACGSGTTSPSTMPPPKTVTLTFSGVTAHGSAVGLYAESGFAISANPGDWIASTTYGNPAPFIQFVATAGTTVTGQIQVTATGHAPFTFKSVDLYSSTTRIPYTITGVRDFGVVFSVTDTLPNTFGNFRTVVNPHGADVIDTLTISLSNASAPCCANPMGLDNVIVGQ